ncbi:ATP-binding protein [Siccirubricoccus sp. KC 17139]|uniref:histidine kinase n=1 Tax=Siccirubricoccus soli TaxID=2899147 RepID=A0ABT1D2S4_9PROT|nr:ATP-binding protein [Siccirubricoccus soli]MCO6416202.1 ATP-binding protein [Siccirubricoccus soli]MCP2682336.1 ATP-binding protein [Siccirubricoccus soli]
MRRALAWLSPATLAGRTVLALLGGLLVFHFGSVWLLERGVRDALEEAREIHVADHAAMAARAIGGLPKELREDAARALSTPAFEAVWGHSGPAEPMDEAALAPLRVRLQRRAPELAGLHLRLGLAPANDGPRRIQGAMRLADASWVSFAAEAPDLAPVPTHASLASLSAMALGIVLASILVVRWITTPLRRLAKAAEAFGKGAAAPVPLPEDGPREVRDAARTFNAMQARIHRLVADRTQALAAVSHDLRTPIQRLRLRAGFLDDTEAQQAIDADLDEMEGMVEATLAYLRGETESEEPRQADLAAILSTLCDDATDRGASATYAGPDRLPILLRPLAVKRALGNLVDNALKHGGGARVTLEEAPGAVTVRVEDDGPGIPEAALEAVFEPFHRLDASRNRGTGGTGLGLAIVRQVVTAHGGTVTVANRREGGLVAAVRLPRQHTSKLDDATNARGTPPRSVLPPAAGSA